MFEAVLLSGVLTAEGMALHVRFGGLFYCDVGFLTAKLLTHFAIYDIIIIYNYKCVKRTKNERIPNFARCGNASAEGIREKNKYSE